MYFKYIKNLFKYFFILDLSQEPASKGPISHVSEDFVF